MTGELTREAARASFVAMIKDENFYSDACKQSLRQHWNGAASGFHDHQVQSRWRDFLAGWQAAAIRQAKGDTK